LEDDLSRELLGVIGAFLLDGVRRDAEATLCGKFLQGRLPVERGTTAGRVVEQRIEQAMDEIVGSRHATGHVHSTEQRLEARPIATEQLRSEVIVGVIGPAAVRTAKVSASVQPWRRR